MMPIKYNLAAVHDQHTAKYALREGDLLAYDKRLHC